MMVHYKEIQSLKETLTNDADFGKKIRPLLPLHITKDFPNDADLGRHFRKINIFKDYVYKK